MSSLKLVKTTGASRQTDHVNGTADAIFDVIGSTGCSQIPVPTVGLLGVPAPRQLDDQTFVRPTLQSQTAVGVEVVDDDAVKQQVNDVGVIPDAFGRQGPAANLQTGDLVCLAYRLKRIIGPWLSSNSLKRSIVPGLTSDVDA